MAKGSEAKGSEAKGSEMVPVKTEATGIIGRKVSDETKDRANKRAEKLAHNEFLYGDTLRAMLPSDVTPYVQTAKRERAGVTIQSGELSGLLGSKDKRERAFAAKCVATAPGAAGVRAVLKLATDDMWTDLLSD